MFSPSLPFLATVRGREKNTMRCSKFLAIAFILLDVSASAYAACVGASCKPLITGDTKNWKYDYSHSDEFDVDGGKSLPVDGKKWSQELGAWTGTNHFFGGLHTPFFGSRFSQRKKNFSLMLINPVPLSYV